MNDFKKSLEESTTKSIDERIQKCLQAKFDRLGVLAEVDEYKNHIAKRASGVLGILNNFDENMDIIEQRKPFSITKDKNSKGYLSALDEIIKESIIKELDKMYNNTVSLPSNFYRKMASQILDREVRLSRLLDNYDSYMEILENYKPKHDSEKSDAEQELG